MFSEVLNGILATRPPSTDNDITAPSIKIGLIPAGELSFIFVYFSDWPDQCNAA